ncbi:threonine ammonia-lyase [Actinomadura madurae]|uniref:threonine ammonia-lyase n=1 Tax=Actinomadura madurae TaxID=1993 RepID=UPI0020D22312|nr:pyridoxal-phosphate dependent enzyme [Actinomadura madurae]MCP9947614.1 pyridoxal-phosphate dependent enzyme [Actinomadura madurae]MCP9964381.1 pyridoxal-phosphate dependent enzyme [Actinomadura madurae]MCP9976861.1 pyridoxal-phosphate dependent enzyme [Actinomadura madurae]MCQ0011646.1 pyridoxal-phosphate dependent enzyme [Actinomadura madurae]MCQ0013046.1 pyridoxal-phosphate dependent enzyme [Actinomadura madurae]
MRVDLDLARIEKAMQVIDPVFLHTPQYVDEQLCQALGGRAVTVKVETANPVRSFKGRGADLMLSTLAPGTPVVCASSGNFGQAIAYAGRSRGMPVEVFVSETINPRKRERMETFGAEIIVAGGDGASAREAAAAHARRHPDRVYLQDGVQAAIAEGAGTIGVELTRGAPSAGGPGFDAVVLPVGDGALINGVGRWMKEHAPGTRIVGVNVEGAPSMLESLRAGRAVCIDRARTFADGIAVRNPPEASVRRARALVDEITLVTDEAIAAAMELAAHTLGIVLEPAGAAGLAAIAEGMVPGDRLATVLTGANPRPEQALGRLRAREQESR